MLRNVTKCYKMLRNVTKCYKIIKLLIWYCAVLRKTKY